MVQLAASQAMQPLRNVHWRIVDITLSGMICTFASAGSAKVDSRALVARWHPGTDFGLKMLKGLRGMQISSQMRAGGQMAVPYQKMHKQDAVLCIRQATMPMVYSSKRYS